MKKIMYVSVVFLIIIVVLLVLGKKNISTEIDINAPVNIVWNEFISFDSYSQWNPFIKKITGKMKLDSVIEVTFETIENGKKNSMTFTPKILLLEKNKIFQWQGRLFIPGIFTGKHTFKLIKISDSKTKLIQKESFNGILVPLFSFDSTIRGFNSMNMALKKRIESKNIK